MKNAIIDVSRLIRIAALGCTAIAVALVYVWYAPQIDALQARIDDGRSELRSDETTFDQAPALRAQRSRLAARYATLLAQNPEAVFVRELATTVRRHHVTLVSTNVTQETALPEPQAASIPFSRARVEIELRGTYRALLGTVADLSTGSEIVEVREPNLRREGDQLAATVPVTVYEPLRSAASSRGSTR
ncbi:MAG: hypothetical protein NVS2B3_08290 [Vulcanimicrobiaceae bacterium]